MCSVTAASAQNRSRPAASHGGRSPRPLVQRTDGLRYSPALLRVLGRALICRAVRACQGSSGHPEFPGSAGRHARDPCKTWTRGRNRRTSCRSAVQLAADHVPSVRAIRAQLHVGQPRAQRLRDCPAAGAARRLESPAARVTRGDITGCLPCSSHPLRLDRDGSSSSAGKKAPASRP